MDDDKNTLKLYRVLWWNDFLGFFFKWMFLNYTSICPVHEPTPLSKPMIIAFSVHRQFWLAYMLTSSLWCSTIYNALMWGWSTCLFGQRVSSKFYTKRQSKEHDFYHSYYNCYLKFDFYWSLLYISSHFFVIIFFLVMIDVCIQYHTTRQHHLTWGAVFPIRNFGFQCNLKSNARFFIFIGSSPQYIQTKNLLASKLSYVFMTRHCPHSPQSIVQACVTRHW